MFKIKFREDSEKDANKYFLCLMGLLAIFFSFHNMDYLK